MEPPPLELLFLWHHHQPDYREPVSRRALLPWVRLHASKDYLDMAEHLERFPTLKATFNFVPSLLDQLEDARRGGSDALFDLLARPIASLAPAERAHVTARCTACPPHARARWPRLNELIEKAGRSATDARAVLRDRELLELEVYFLLAWCDPLYHGEPEAAQAITRAGGLTESERDGLLDLHARLLERVLPAYRRLAERGQAELSATPYYHPILPLLIDVTSGRRSRPDSAIPREALRAADDAHRQIVDGRRRHAEIFGAAPRGMWPSEGSVSPEAMTLAAECGVGWAASDEGVLFASRRPDHVERSALYQPYRWVEGERAITLFFRDRDLSDRIGFVYQRWAPDAAVEDFVERLRHIRAAHAGERPAVVSVILDGENCWEGYPDDGKPFLEALYARLAASPEIRTRTFSEVAAEWSDAPRLERLHSGSWIDADFHIWVGHPEKNRAWDLVARTRAALVHAGVTPESRPDAWGSLFAAEGSDWYWWLGEDHFTSDKALFEQLFRGHLRAALTWSDCPVPAELHVPVFEPSVRSVARNSPIGFLRPSVDGTVTHYYEWELGGHYHLLGSGGAMHRTGGTVKDLYYGFDADRFFLRLDFVDGEDERKGLDLALDFLAPRALRVLVHGMGQGSHPVSAGEGEVQRPIGSAECEVGTVLELGVPFEALGLVAGDRVELVALTLSDGRPIESFPSHERLRFTVPSPDFEDTMWSA